MVTRQESRAEAAAQAAGSDDPSDDALMLSYRSGDGASFDTLYQRYRTVVYRFFLRQLPKAEAEECHQEVWLKLINARTTYEPRGEFRAYLFTIAHRTLADRHRRNMKHAAVDTEAAVEDVADGAAGPAAATAAGREVERLYRCIAALPVAQREALLMKKTAGLTLGEIAQITDTSEEGVKSRLRYAMQKLRQALAPS